MISNMQKCEVSCTMVCSINPQLFAELGHRRWSNAPFEPQWHLTPWFLRRHRGAFGCAHEQTDKTWNRLDKDNQLPNRVRPVNPLDAMCHMKNRDSEHTTAALCDKDEKTIQKWSWSLMCVITLQDWVSASTAQLINHGISTEPCCLTLHVLDCVGGTTAIGQRICLQNKPRWCRFSCQ